MSTLQFSVTLAVESRSFEFMLHGLAQFGSAFLLIGSFTVVLLVLLILGLAAIPGRVRGRKG
jgi:hypothetical protein